MRIQIIDNESMELLMEMGLSVDEAVAELAIFNDVSEDEVYELLVEDMPVADDYDAREAYDHKRIAEAQEGGL